jgi:succinoglycan biosynthesis protein ExoA
VTSAQEFPLVSVLLPVRNEGDHIATCLDAICRQDYPEDRLQTLVIDGLSSDKTREIVAKAICRQSNLSLVDNPAGTVPAALNLGIRHSKGDVIVRVDGHTVVAPDYVRECVEELRRTGADNVGGRMNAVGKTPFGRAAALATSSPFGVGGARFHYSEDEEWVDTVYLGAWPRSVFGRIGLFDEELDRDQDDEFNYRLRAAGGRILLSPRIKSHYTVRGSPSMLWQQYFQYGFWKVRVLQKHARQMQWRQFVPAVFVAALVGTAGLWIARPVASLPFLVVACTYLLANVLASIRMAARRGWQAFLLLPVAFAALHVGYGLGFLAGLARFATRWGDRIGRVPAWSWPHDGSPTV